MNKKIFLFILFFFLINNYKQLNAEEISNRVKLTVNNLPITELDIKKEINYLKFLNKHEKNIEFQLLEKDSINNLINRKIREIETDYNKIDISENEIENNLYEFLLNKKINKEELDHFYNINEIEKNYLRNIIKTDLKWAKLIKQLYEKRININLTEINKEVENLEKIQNIKTNDKELREELINLEQNKLLNKYSLAHLEKSKKKYLINYL
jgi:hypothetical protein